MLIHRITRAAEHVNFVSLLLSSGLDPAAPCFVNDENCNMLSPLTEIKLDDALFVDAIHTCVGSAGIREAIAHADFFPNGGSPSQPGCPSVRVLQGELETF